MSLTATLFSVNLTDEKSNRGFRRVYFAIKNIFAFTLQVSQLCGVPLSSPFYCSGAIRFVFLRFLVILTLLIFYHKHRLLLSFSIIIANLVKYIRGGKTKY